MATPSTALLRDHAPALPAAGGLAVLPWIVIPYDSLTHLMGADLSSSAQTLPLTALLSLPYLAIRAANLRSCAASRRVAAWLFGAAAAVVLITVVNMVLEGIVPQTPDTAWRVSTAVRQGVSLLLGLTSYLMFQDALLRLGHRRSFLYLLMGGIPSLALAIGQFALGLDRVQGFSSEPSHLGDLLVFGLFPACFVAFGTFGLRVLFGTLSAFALVATFSTTAYLKAGAALSSFYVMRGQALRAAIALPVLGGAIFAALTFAPDNYAFTMITFMQQEYNETGQLAGASFIDRFFGFVGPASMLDQPHAWFGYGLGADTVYFDRLFDPDTAAAIREVKGDIPSISSLQGKWLLYGGVWGYALYLAAYYSAWRNAPRRHAARVLIPAVFVSSLFSLGPFFLAYAWLWLAVGATASSSPAVPRASAPLDRPVPSSAS